VPSTIGHHASAKAKGRNRPDSQPHADRAQPCRT